MSSISSTRGGTPHPSDSKTQRDREVESLKEEIRQLNETHRTEMAKLESENKKRIDDVHNDSNAKLNEKDVQYQKEIQKIRAMYTKRGTENEA